ncbi:MAG: hypothetical protein KC777_14715 [Cyanobacteria bacterium HKST-UBA02]|nr:hypothetical protein [Cyanobacteria bacterium HKST-UBA02]
MPANCAYCGQAVDGDGFICSHCAGSPQAPLEYSFEAMQHSLDSVAPAPHASHAHHVTHVYAEPPVELFEDSEPEMIQVKPERTARFSSTEIKRTAKPKETKQVPATKEKKSKRERKAPAVDWKKQKIHGDFTARTKAIKVFLQTPIAIVFLLSIFHSFESNQPIMAFITFAVAGVVLTLIGFIFKVVLFFRNNSWTRFATYIYHHRPPQECQVKLISARPPYTVSELVVISQSGKQQKRSRLKVVHTNANPALFMRSTESNRLPDDTYRGSLRRGSTEGLDAAIVTIGDCRYWCVPDRD